MALDAFDFLLGAKAFLGLQTKADLVNGKVPESQLPSYVDDVIEVEDFAHLPETGESGKIYVTLDTGESWRWSGTTYVPVSTPDSVSYKAQTGKTEAEKAQARTNIGAYAKPDAGIPKTDLNNDVQSSLDNADAAVKYDTNSQNLTDVQKANARTNIGVVVATNGEIDAILNS